MEHEDEKGIVLKVISSRVKSFIEYNVKNGLTLPFIEPTSKNQYIIKRFFQLYKNCLKVYMPVHILFMILRLIRNKKNKPLSTVLRSIKGLIGSTIFATLFAMSVPLAYGYLNTVVKKVDTTWYGMMISFTFSWAILFESSSRWSEMSLYVLSNWFEGFTYSIYKRKYAPIIPHWEKYLFAITMGIISWGYYEISGKELTEEESAVFTPEQQKMMKESDEEKRKTKMEYAFSYILGAPNMIMK